MSQESLALKDPRSIQKGFMGQVRPSEESVLGVAAQVTSSNVEGYEKDRRIVLERPPEEDPFTGMGPKKARKSEKERLLAKYIGIQGHEYLFLLQTFLPMEFLHCLQLMHPSGYCLYQRPANQELHSYLLPKMISKVSREKGEAPWMRAMKRAKTGLNEWTEHQIFHTKEQWIQRADEPLFYEGINFDPAELEKIWKGALKTEHLATVINNVRTILAHGKAADAKFLPYDQLLENQGSVQFHLSNAALAWYWEEKVKEKERLKSLGRKKAKQPKIPQRAPRLIINAIPDRIGVDWVDNRTRVSVFDYKIQEEPLSKAALSPYEIAQVLILTVIGKK